jgi:hypothetical protein
MHTVPAQQPAGRDRERARAHPGDVLGATGPGAIARLVGVAIDDALGSLRRGDPIEVQVELLLGGHVRVTDNGTPLSLDELSWRLRTGPMASRPTRDRLWLVTALAREARIESAHAVVTTESGAITAERTEVVARDGTMITFLPERELLADPDMLTLEALGPDVVPQDPSAWLTRHLDPDASVLVIDRASGRHRRWAMPLPALDRLAARVSSAHDLAAFLLTADALVRRARLEMAGHELAHVVSSCLRAPSPAVDRDIVGRADRMLAHAVSRTPWDARPAGLFASFEAAGQLYVHPEDAAVFCYVALAVAAALARLGVARDAVA